MSKKILTVLAIFVVMLVVFPFSRAEATTNVTPLPAPTAEQISTLNRLYAQIATLQTQLNKLKAQAAGLQSELRLTKRLFLGSKGNEVRTLQRILATDPSVYPEGLVTGHFGPLTAQAVRRLHSKFKLEVRGEVDATTLDLINTLLEAQGITGATIPQDLLTSGSNRIKIEIKNNNGENEYKIDVKCDSRGSGNTCKDDDEDEDDDDDDDDDEDNDNHGNRDRIAPIITSKTVTNIATSTAIVTWVTNEPTTGKVHYALATPVAGQSGRLVQFDNTLGTTSSATLSNLTASTTYYYYIKAVDASNNFVTTPDANFTTTN